MFVNKIILGLLMYLFIAFTLLYSCIIQKFWKVLFLLKTSLDAGVKQRRISMEKNNFSHDKTNMKKSTFRANVFYSGLRYVLCTVFL